MIIKREPGIAGYGPAAPGDRWRATRLLGSKSQRSSSVPELLLCREMGLPFFSRSLDTSSNHFNEVSICRQLVKARTAQFEDEVEAKRAVDVGLKRLRQEVQNGKKRESKFWNRICCSETIEHACLADTKLWILTKGKRGREFVERFFSLEPYSVPGFRKFRGSTFAGKKLQNRVLNCRSLSSKKTSTFLVTLLENGYLRIYDILKTKIIQEIHLQRHYNKGDLLDYKSIEVCDCCGKIFVMGKTNNNVKTILVLTHPPWTELELIHVTVPLTSIGVINEACFLFHKSKLHFTSWSQIRASVTKLENNAGKYIPAKDLKITFEAQLSQMPDEFACITVQSPHYGILQNVWPPVYFVEAKNALKIFKFSSDNRLLYEIPSKPDNEVELIPFPDGSPRLVCQDENYALLNVETKRLNPDLPTDFSFKAVNPLEKGLPSAPAALTEEKPATTSESSRPRRSCARVQSYTFADQQEPQVLTGEYVGMLDLLVFLIAEGDNCQVRLYDPKTLKLIRSLPPIEVWHTNHQGITKRNAMRSVELYFEADFIFLIFHYDNTVKPEWELFFARPMLENAMLKV